MSPAAFSRMSIEELAAEISIYHQELIFQNDELMRKNQELESIRSSLQESQEQYQALFDEAPVGYIILDENARIRAVNQACLALLRGEPQASDPARLLGTDFTALVHPDDQDAFYYSLLHIQRQGHSTISELRLLVGGKTISVAFFSNRQVGDQNSPYTIRSALIDLTASKQAAVAMNEMARRYDLALEGAEAGIWDYNLMTGAVYYSPLYKRILGYEDWEFANHYDSWRNAWHPDDAVRIQQTMDDYLHGRTEKYELTHRLRHKDGTYRWINARGGALADATGRKYRFVGTISDVTDLIRDRNQLAELQRFFTISPNLNAILDQDGTIRQYNQAWLVSLGYCDADMRQISLEQLIHPQDRQMAVEKVTQLVNNSPIAPITVRFQARDGTYRLIEWYLQSAENWIYATGIDITDKVRMQAIADQQQKKLQERNQLIETILEHAPMAIWMSGDQPASIFMNRFAQEHFMLSAAEMAVCHQTDLVAEADHEPQYFEETVTFTDQQLHTLTTVKQRLENSDGRLIGVLGLGLDITERKRAEAALREEREILQTTLNALQEGIIVTDIKGVITMINPWLRATQAGARRKLAASRCPACSAPSISRPGKPVATRPCWYSSTARALIPSGISA